MELLVGILVYRRSQVCAVLMFGLASILPIDARGEHSPSTAPSYESPYSVQFTTPQSELIGDILAGERGKPEQLSTYPLSQWTSAQVLKRYGAWGPPSKTFDPPAGIAEKSAAFKRERVIAIALRYKGYSYQHHHLPDWDPPADWPWKEVGRGHNAKGVDCSNFTGFVYNLGLGIKLSGDIGTQAEQAEPTTTGAKVRVQTIEKPKTYAECTAQLRTGDLLYVKNREGSVSHVIFWVGSIGRSPDGVPLILDSTGTGHTDCNGVDIPDGVHLRPFLPNGWYWKSLSHVHRVIPD